MVFSSSNHIEAGIVQGALASAGVQVFSRGEILNTITAEVSLEGGRIELYVHNNDLPQAEEVLNNRLSGDELEIAALEAESITEEGIKDNSSNLPAGLILLLLLVLLLIYFFTS